MRVWVLWFLVLSALIKGCAPLPKEFQGLSFEKSATLSQVLSSPEKYINVDVLWGGRIITCTNLANETLFEILQFPLDLEGRPKENALSEGRFKATFNKFLDCALYSPGRLVTVGGSLKEFKEGKIGERPYTFPWLEGKAIYLWREERAIQVECLSPWWYPWYRCIPYPYFHPWWCP